MLLAVIRSSELREEPPHTTMLEVLPVGRECLLTPRIAGTLYFRVNDFWNELADNTGSYQVTIKEMTTDISPPYQGGAGGAGGLVCRHHKSPPFFLFSSRVRTGPRRRRRMCV